MRQLNGSSEDGKGILVDEDGSEEAGNVAIAGSTSANAPRFPNKTYEFFYK